MSDSKVNRTQYSAEYLMELIEDLAKGETLASHQNTPAHIFPELLIRYPNQVLRNPSCPQEILVSSCKPHQRVCYLVSVSLNPSLPIQLMEQLSKHSHLDVRSALAKNPSISEELLCTLSQDISSQVRAAAASNLRLPFSVLLKMVISEGQDSSVIKFLMRSILFHIDKPEIDWNEEVRSVEISYPEGKQVFDICSNYLEKRLEQFLHPSSKYSDLEFFKPKFKPFLIHIGKLNLKRPIEQKTSNN